MGRKSNAKKQIRKLLKEKKAKEKKSGLLTKLSKKKSKKELKKELLKKQKSSSKSSKKSKTSSRKTSKNTKLKINYQKIYASFFALSSLTLLIILTLFLFQKAYKPVSIAKYLPEDRTIISLELNVNLEHSQAIKGFNLFHKYPKFTQASLIQSIEEYYTLDFDQDLKPWLGRQIGYALLHPIDHEDYLESFYFIEYSNLEAALDHFGISNLSSDEILSFSDQQFLMLLDNYLVISDQKASLQNLKNNKTLTLFSSPKYRRIQDNLPLNNLAYLYIDFSKIDQNVISNIPFLSQNGFSLVSIQPVIDLFSAEGFSLITNPDNLVVQSFLSLNTDKLKEKKYITLKEKYQAHLTAFTQENTLAFWGGKNLQHQINKIFEVLAQGDTLKVKFLYQLIDNRTKKYFGPQTSFKKDILPLFDDEFALLIENSNQINIYKLLFKLENPSESIPKLEQIISNFATLGSVFETKIVEHILEDGTYTREEVAVAEDITSTEIIYNNYHITELTVGNKPWGIYYTSFDDLVVIASHIDGIKSTIDIMNGEAPSLRNSQIFDQQITPLLQHSDEITYLDLQSLIPIFFPNSPDFLKTLSSISSGKNYFHDGIVTINYLGIN